MIKTVKILVRTKEQHTKLIKEADIGTIFIKHKDCIFVKINSDYVYYICSSDKQKDIESVIDDLIKSNGARGLIYISDIIKVTNNIVMYDIGKYRIKELKKWIIKNSLVGSFS